MKKQSLITRLITFSLCFCLLFSSFPVHASGHIGNGGGINRTYEKPTGWKTWDLEHRIDWLLNNAVGSIFTALGVIINPSASTYTDYFESFLNLRHEIILEQGSTSWEDYINSHFQANAAETEVTVSSEFVNDFRTWLEGELDEQTGYFFLPTFSPEELPAEFFPDKESYDFLYNYIKNLDDNTIYLSSFINSYSEYCRYSLVSEAEYLFLSQPIIPADYYRFYLYDLSWNLVYPKNIPVDGFSFGSEITSLSPVFPSSSSNSFYTYFLSFSNDSGLANVNAYTSNGRKIRVFKNLSALKNYSVNKRPYYCTSNYYNYNSSNDNSVTTNENNYISNDEYNNYYNQVINNITENNITNGISEEQLAQIIDAIVNANNNNNGGSGGSSGGDSSGGSGILDMVEGVGKLLDFILSLVGKLVGLISDFLTNVLSMLGNFTAFTDGFGEFLTEAFGFLPPEAIASISLGVTVIVVLAIIKFLKG